VKLAKEVSQENLGSRGLKGLWAHLDHQDSEVRKVKQVKPEQLDLMVHLEDQVKEDLLV